MQFNRHITRQRLRDFEFEPLFIEELGWERLREEVKAEIRESEADYGEYRLTAVAEKRGLAVFHCSGRIDGSMPDHAARGKIQRRVAKSVHEHLIIYTDPEKTTQIWQSVKREPGKPLACREHHYNREQSGEALIQKLEKIAFSLEDEENLTVVDVTRRVQTAFAVEQRITKQFYDRFKTEHAQFLKFLSGIPDDEMQRWYASVMLNRLMFIYFIQKKGFLNNDTNYLRTKLAESKVGGTDRYYTAFLCPLFFEGFAKPESERNTEARRLLGTVPYLNGGIFQRHQLEELHGEKIQIADAAFEGLFSFFEAYQWHLDDRPLRNDNEINPDVLGYIFEKYINQKQMGAYYTKEDITEYISKNTIVPFLLDTARENCKIAFTLPVGAIKRADNEGDRDSPSTPDTSASVWQLLVDNPNRYIYDAVKKGVKLNLPAKIADGINDVSARTEWNTRAPDDYALPTEIWREVVARRARYNEVYAKLSNGEIHEVNDLITYNLNIRQFAQDIIENCEGPELLRAFWSAITQVTVLDPTCGSGAFLFAALNIIEPLYDACLDRMQVFLDELRYAGESPHPKKYTDFREILDRVDEHANRKYFILKSIIINNLYGVDIMEEAVEICKLRLFLKMVAQIEDIHDIEPLPDIDFNIQVGNALVGYTTYDAVEEAFTSQIDVNTAMNQIKEDAEEVERLFVQFRQQQTELGRDVSPAEKHTLQTKLVEMDAQLNRYLAGQYGIEPNNKPVYHNWLGTHKPFHWFIQFYGILKNGGFDVIIGNPPYLELRQVDYTPATHLTSHKTAAIHAMCVDCSLRLLNRHGCMSMIVPLALVSTQRMQIIQRLLEKSHSVWYANYSWRPGKLFDTVNRALTIFTTSPSKQDKTFSTNYQKWNSDNRDLLMRNVDYVEIPRHRSAVWAPKLGLEIEKVLLEKCLKIKTGLSLFMTKSKHKVFYRTDGGLYWKVFTDFPPVFKVNGRFGHSTRETSFSVLTAELLRPVIAILSSNLFWWWYSVTSNCRHLNPYDVHNFPTPKPALYNPQLAELGEIYLEDLQRNSSMLVRLQKQTGQTETQSFKIQNSKPIIDEIDRVLAQHYDFTDEELDFIINYDIKYRMGLGSGA